MAGSLRNRLLATAFVIGAASACVAPQALAQGQTPAVAPASGPAGAPHQRGESGGDVVVTAEKRAERLSNVAASVSVVPGRELEQMRSVQLVDFAGYVPGLFVAPSGAPGQARISLDGIGPIAGASEVGFYINDTPIGSSSSFQSSNSLAIDLMPYDLTRVEVLHGPQGTLYGASTMGGLIKYVLADPNLTTLSGRIGGDLFGVQNARSPGGGVRGQINVPVVQDRLAIRASAYDEYTPGYIDNITTGQKGDNQLRQTGGRVSALFAASPDVSLELSVIYQYNHADNQSIVALSQGTLRPIGGALSNVNVRPEPFTQELQLYDAKLTWDLHFAQLTSVTSYQDLRDITSQDVSAYVGQYLGLLGGPGPSESSFVKHYRVEKFTQEVRLASPTDQRLEWLIGAFYTHERGTNHEIFNDYDLNGAPIAFSPFEVVTLPSVYQEYAVFGDATFHFTDAFDLSAGLRYAHNDQSFIETEGGAFFNPAAPFAPVLVVPGKSSEGVTTFSVSPRYHFTPNTMLYARIASGYQPGGPNVVLPGQTAPSQFHSAMLTDYQLGLKSTFLDGRATADLSAFYIDWSHIQVSVLVGSGSAVQNAGAARSEGFDFSGDYSPFRGLVLGGALAYTDAYLTTAVPSITAAAGARLPGVPFWSGSLTAEYSQPLMHDWSGFIGGGYRYVGPRFSDVEGSTSNGGPQGLAARAYNVVDLHFGARNPDWTVTVFAKNLFDERAYLTPSEYFTSLLGQPIDITAPVLQPRTVGISIDRAF